MLSVELRVFGDVPLGIYQNSPWNPHDPLIWPAACRWWQVRSGFRSDVRTDDGEVAIVKFPYVGAAI